MKAPLLLLLAAFAVSAQQPPTSPLSDGHVMTRENGSQQAWDAEKKQWVTLDQFWQHYADRRGGLTWGERVDYPPYHEVKELDTLLVILETGPCLMEFFHQRWRRANDVRRWDEAFNEYGSCPHVFD